MNWKEKHLIDLKKELDLMEQQIELDKKIYLENINKKNDIKEVISKLENINE